ncbi:MAG: hypothetical protein Q9212_003166 [Teloschistes hypoglaucus]
MSVFINHVQIPSLSSLYFRDDRVHDIGADYSQLRGPKRYNWSRHEKEVLNHMNDFDNSSTQLQEVFHAYFAGKYANSQKPRKAAWDSMRSHIAHQLRHSKSSDRRVSRGTRTRIASIAVSIGIQLHPKAHTGPIVKSRPHRKKDLPAVSETSLSDNDWSSEGPECSDDTLNQSLAKAGTPGVHSTHPPLRGLLTPPSTNAKKHRVWGAQREGTDEGIPPIVFRAFNDNSQNSVDGFIAGSFVGKTTIPVLPTESLYLRELERHLAREHSGNTEFISLCQNLMRVIHHAIRCSEKPPKNNGSEWKIAAIDLSQFSGSVQSVWKLDAGEHSRKAFGEWVVWGVIPPSNILAVVSMDEFLACMSRNLSPFYMDIIQRAKYTGQARKAIVASVSKRTLNYNDGLSVGHLLKSFSIPSQFLEYSTHNILADWRWPERLSEIWKDNPDFIRGLNAGYNVTAPDLQPTDISSEKDGRLIRQASPSRASGPTSQHINGAPPDTNEWLTDFFTELEVTAGLFSI